MSTQQSSQSLQSGAYSSGLGYQQLPFFSQNLVQPSVIGSQYYNPNLEKTSGATTTWRGPQPPLPAGVGYNFQANRPEFTADQIAQRYQQRRGQQQVQPQISSTQAQANRVPPTVAANQSAFADAILAGNAPTSAQQLSQQYSSFGANYQGQPGYAQQLRSALEGSGQQRYNPQQVQQQGPTAQFGSTNPFASTSTSGLANPAASLFGGQGFTNPQAQSGSGFTASVLDALANLPQAPTGSSAALPTSAQNQQFFAYNQGSGSSNFQNTSTRRQSGLLQNNQVRRNSGLPTYPSSNRNSYQKRNYEFNPASLAADIGAQQDYAYDDQDYY